MTFQANCLFVDDIRDELGNKTSMMGVYGRSVNVKTVPATIPKFCVCTQLSTLCGEEFSSVSVTIKLNDAVLSESEVPKDFINKFWLDTRGAIARGELAPYERVTLAINALISPLRIDQASRMVVGLVVDGEIVEAGSIRFIIPQ